jgi:hypothetical protein
MNISGSPCDKRDTIAKAAAMDEHIDVLVGDWMSELNVPTRAYNVANGLGVAYEETFLKALEPALDNIAKKGIKLAANAGTVATKELYDVVVNMVAEKKLDLTVAWIEGDAVLDLVKDDLKKDPKKFVHISAGKSLDQWGFDPLFAQCYLGGMGIAMAFKAGADIVICGRVADASPIIGAAAWWHNCKPYFPTNLLLPSVGAGSPGAVSKAGIFSLHLCLRSLALQLPSPRWHFRNYLC